MQVDPETGEILTDLMEAPDGHGADVVLEPTNTYGVSNNIESCGYSDEELVTVKAGSEQAVKDAVALDGKVDQELMRRATERGATTIYGKDMNYVIETKNEYDRTKLPPFLELLNPEGKDKCFTPAHLETVEVPDKWDMTQVKKYARARGKEALDIVEKATFPGKASGKLVKND